MVFLSFSVRIIISSSGARAEGLSGGFEIQGKEDFDRLMNKFLSDETCLHKAGKNAGDYVRNNAGALEKIMNTVSL